MSLSEVARLEPRKAPLEVASVVAIMLGFHLACLAVFVTGVSTPALVAAVVMFVVRGMGVTTGFHRLLAHRSFKTGRVVQFILALGGSLATQGGPLWWVAHHRAHHRDTDTDLDIHSPVTKGLWQSHIGWMMSHAAFNEKGANSRDLHKFPELKFLQRHYIWIILLQIAAIYAVGSLMHAVVPEWGTTGAQMLVWGFFISTVLTWHVTFMVNSVCHRWGARPYETGDASTNNVFIGIFAFGEGWHNNHHKFPFSARHGLRWWQVDATWWLLKLLEALGLVWDLKLPRDTAEKPA
jgi:stearoyl-CoA desaturase (delta-9 desaturase)